MSIALSVKNKKARPVGYEKVKGSANSSFSSRNMGILGFIIFVFLVIHMRSFWYEMHWGSIQPDTAGNKDLYSVVNAAFSQWWYVALYVVCMVGLAFHLSHGFSSAFQTLGINHKKYTPFIKKLGIVYAILIPAAFAIIPLIMFFNS
jgi:succinate dehydrogenase / fumarate reductase cytochrome b subunit